MLIIKFGVTSRVDGQGDAIVRACDAHNLIVLNDGLPILSASRVMLALLSTCPSLLDIRLLASVSTLQDLHGSDHFSVFQYFAGTSPSMYKFSNRLNLSDKQLASFYSRLALETSKFYSLIFSPSTLLNRLQKYEKFCSLLSDTVSLFYFHGIFPPRKKLISSKKITFPLVESHMRRGS